MDSGEIELEQDEDAWAAAMAAAEARAAAEQVPEPEPEAEPEIEAAVSEKVPLIEPEALVEDDDEEEAPPVEDPALARLAEKLRAGRAAICVGPRLLAQPTLRERIARCIELLSDEDAPLAWEALHNRPLAAGGFVKRQLGEVFAEAVRELDALDEREPPAAAARLCALPFRAAITTTGAESLRALAPKAELHELELFSTVELHATLASKPIPALRELFRTRSILFVGFEPNDHELTLLLDHVFAGQRAEHEHFALLGGLSAVERDDLAEAWKITALEDRALDDLAGALEEAIAQAKPVPDWNDADGWLALLTDDDDHEEARAELERICAELRESGDYDKLVEVMLGRAGAERSPEKRSAILLTVARIYEHEVEDRERALTALLAAWRDAPDAASWHELERLADEKWDQVAEELRDVLPRMPASVRIPLYRDSGNWAQLAQALDDAAAENGPSRRAFLREAAEVHGERLGNRGAAIARYEQLAADDPTDVPILRALERLYGEDGRHAHLRDLLERRAQLARDDHERVALYRRLALLWSEVPDGAARAQAWWETLLAIEPEAEDALRALELIYRVARKWKELLDTLQKRAELVESDERAELLLQIASVYEHELSKHDLALEACVAAEACAPAKAETLAALAEIERRNGKLLRAAKLLGQAAESAQNPLQKTRLYIESGECFQSLDDDTRALKCYLDALEIDSEHADAGARAADILWNTQRWDELTGILEMLLRKEQDPRRLLLYWSRLGRAARLQGATEKAVKAWLRTLDFEPRHHEALKALGEHYLGEERWAEALPLLDRRFQHHHDKLTPVEIVELFGDMARCELSLGAREAARELIARALAQDPQHRPSLVLQVRAADGPDETILAKRALARIAEGDERVKLLAEIGDLLLTELGETAQAVEAWREALKFAPGDHKLLHKCLDAHVAARDWATALAVLDELIEQERAADVRAKYRHTAGLVCRDELRRPDLALAYLRGALDDDPELDRTAIALEQLFTERRDWKELARLWRRQLKQLGANCNTDGKDSERLRLWTKLGTLCADELRDFESAAAAFEVTVALEPENLERRKRLADLYVQAGPRSFARSIEEHQLILRAEKDRVHSYRALKHLYIQTKQREKSLFCSWALVALKRGEADDARKLAEHKKKPFATARQPLSDESWHKLRQEDVLIDCLFALLAPVLVPLQAQTHKALGLNRKEAIELDDPHSYNKVLKYVCRVMGVPVPEAYAVPEQKEAVIFGNATDGKDWLPVFLLGAPLVGPNRREADQVFEIARRVALLKPERLFRLTVAHPEPLSHFIDAAMALDAQRDGEQLTGDIARIAESLSRALGPAATEQVATVGERLRAARVRPEAAALAWLKATDLTALRAAWALAGDLEAGARSIAAEGASPLTHPQTQRLLDLVWGSTTEEQFSVRRQLGLM
jgi:tetratricopeptide (TPR) repeat protein